MRAHHHQFQTAKASGPEATLSAKLGLSAGAGCTNNPKADVASSPSEFPQSIGWFTGTTGQWRAWDSVVRFFVCRFKEYGKSRSGTLEATSQGSALNTEQSQSNEQRIAAWRERNRQAGNPSQPRHERPDGDLPPALAAGGSFRVRSQPFTSGLDALRCAQDWADSLDHREALMAVNADGSLELLMEVSPR